MLSKTYLGQPVILGKGENKMYFRITKLEGSFVRINHGNKKLHSIVSVTTPGGNTIQSGMAFLFQAVDTDLEKLIEYEELHKKSQPNDPLYNALLTEKQIALT